MASATDDQLVRILELVEFAWRNLAAIVWRGYLTKGRGFVTLDFSKDLERDSFTYTAMRDCDCGGSHTAWQDTCRICQQYEPETEIVVVFSRYVDDDSITPLRVMTPEGMPHPPELVS